MPKKKIPISTGFIPEVPKTSDYIFGVASNIPFVERVLDGNWKEYLPIGETQNTNFERMNCVTMSGNNSLETQLNWMLRHNRMSSAGSKFLYDNKYIVDNKVNLSDRFTAIMSGTTKQGNWFTAVGDSMRKDGVTPQSMLLEESLTWDEYYNKTVITDAMISMGKEFLKHFTIGYEWVITTGNSLLPEQDKSNALKSLRHAPNWLGQHGHATELYLGVDKQKWGQFESYKPYEQELKWNNLIGIVLKLVIDNKTEYSIGEVLDAQKQVISIMKGRPTHYFFRPNAKGEGYKSYLDGSIKYFHQSPGSLFTEMCEDETITPLGEDLWNKIKAAEIK